MNIIPTEAGYEMDYYIAKNILMKETYQEMGEKFKKWYDNNYKMGFFQYSTYWRLMNEFIIDEMLHRKYEVKLEESSHKGVCRFYYNRKLVAKQTGTTIMEAFGKCLIQIKDNGEDWHPRNKKIPYSYKRPKRNPELDYQVAKEALRINYFYLKNEEERDYYIRDFINSNKQLGNHQYSSQLMWMNVALRDYLFPEDYKIIMHFKKIDKHIFTLQHETKKEILQKEESDFITESFAKALVQQAEIDPFAFHHKKRAEGERLKVLLGI